MAAAPQISPNFNIPRPFTGNLDRGRWFVSLCETYSEKEWPHVLEQSLQNCIIVLEFHYNRYIYSIVIKFFEIRNNLIWLIKLGLNTCMIHACVSWVFAKILKDGPMKDRLWWAFDEDRTTSNVTIKFLIPRGITPGAESDVHE